MLRQAAIRDEAKSEKIKRYQKEREEAGVPDIFATEKDKLEARRKRGEESERETAKGNLIRFLTKWGTIPGSTMRGLIGAGSDLVDKMDIDEKHKQKFLNELDDIDSKINSAEYARRLGDENRARDEQQKAGEMYFKLAHDLRTAKVNYALKEMDNVAKYEIAELKANLAATKVGNKPADVQLVDKYFEGLVAEGNPADAKTYKMAIEKYMKLKPGVQAAEIGLGPKNISAKAEETRAETDIKKEKTQEEEAARKRKEHADEEIKTETSGRDFRKTVNAAIKAEKADTPEKKEAIRAREKQKIKDRIYTENKVDVPAPAAPAATTPAKPALKWDPATGTWK